MGRGQLKIRVGTRGSRLALAQTKTVVDALSAKVAGLEFQVVTIKTLGDRLPPEKRGETDGKGAFTDDIESHLLRGDIDMAVHSLKDVSAELGAGLKLAATPARGDPRDALVPAGGLGFEGLPEGARIGTSSIRRRVQLVKLRRDLRMVELHGNVETRISKLARLGLDGVVLAAAGLDRLSLGERARERFEPEVLVPAAGQGTLAVEVREGDSKTETIASKINDEATMRASECERAFVRVVGGDCSFPVGAYASTNGGRSIALTGIVASTDGARFLKRKMSATDAEGLGRTLAEEMLQLGGAAILRSCAT